MAKKGFGMLAKQEQARAKLGALYSECETWLGVAALLCHRSDRELHQPSIATMANRAMNEHAIAPIIYELLGMKKKRFRRAIEFTEEEDAELFDKWLADAGHTSATDWFMQSIWEQY